MPHEIRSHRVSARPHDEEGRTIFVSRRLGAVAIGAAAVGLALALVALGAAVRQEGAPVVDASAASPAGLVVSSTTLASGEVVLCLVDTGRQRLAVYVADAKRSRLKLLAVRDISADWALTDYNNDPPLPKDVRTRVEKVAGEVAPDGQPKP